MSGDTPPADARLEPVRERVRDCRRDRDVPGLAIAACARGRTLWAEGLGHLARGRAPRVGPDTIFGLASVTKIYTAAAIADAVEQGLVAYEAPVSRWLPELPFAANGALRVRHLLAHTSGLPPLSARYHALDLRRPGHFTGGAMDMDSVALAGPHAERAAFCDLQGLVAFLAGHAFEPHAATGELHSYSNEGYGLLGALLERASGRTFEEYLRERVLRPRGLARTALGPSAAESLGDCAVPHHRIGGEVRAIHAWEAPAWYAAGGLRASVLDLLRFLSALEPRHQVFEVAATDPATGDGYAGGVAVGERFGEPLAWHDGSQDGTSSAFLLAPERGLAVAAVANLDGIDVASLARSTLCALIDAPLDSPAHPDEPTAPAAPLADYAGTYASPEGHRLHFEHRDDQLVLLTQRATLPCRPLGGDRIALGHQRARFLRRHGEVWALAMGRILRRQC